MILIYIYIYAYDMHSSYEFVARTAWDWHVWPIRSVVIEKGMNAIREIITIHIYIYNIGKYSSPMSLMDDSWVHGAAKSKTFIMIWAS